MRALFPTDGSTATEEAFARFLSLFDGMQDGLEVTVLNVTDEGFDLADHPYVKETFDDEERDEVFPSPEASQRAIDRCLEIAKRHDVDLATKIVEGTYREAILREAEEHDVLVMHELRRSNIKDLFRGSKTEKLTRRAPCSVLLIDIDEMD